MKMQMEIKQEIIQKRKKDSTIFLKRKKLKNKIKPKKHSVLINEKKI